MKKFAAIAVFIFSFIFASAQNSGSKYQSGITPIGKAHTNVLSDQNKTRFGIGLYPIAGQVSLREHFGQSRFGNRLFLEQKFGLQYESFEFLNLKFSWRDIQFDNRLLFAWHNKQNCRLYSGIGLAFIGMYYAVDDWDLYGYREIIPIGMELFPSERLPNLGLIGETALRELSGLHINAGLVYYLR